MTRLHRAWVALLLVVASSALAAPDLKTIMADPDWIGPPVESVWWDSSDEGYYYKVKRAGSDQRDVVHATASGEGVLTGLALTSVGGSDPVYNRDRTKVLTVSGNRLLMQVDADPALRTLFTGEAAPTQPIFDPDGEQAYFHYQDQWWAVATRGSQSAYPITALRFEASPYEIADDAMSKDQARLFQTLDRVREREAAGFAEQLEQVQQAPTLGAAPWYLGADFKPVESALSADGEWLLVTVTPADNPAPKRDRMPRYVTASGYVEVEDVRHLVGRDAPSDQQLWLLHLPSRELTRLDLMALNGRDQDPLAALKTEQRLVLHDADNLRPLRVTSLQWHPTRPIALVQLRAVDNKDRWIAWVDARSGVLHELHRLHDPAWVNWYHNELGWLADTETAWFLSEESGYNHLYTAGLNGGAHQHTRGDFELRQVTPAPDGRSVYAISNRAHPTQWDVIKVELATNALSQLTTLKGVEDFRLSADGQRAALRYSSSYVPMQAAVVDLEDGELSLQTDTRTPEYSRITWQQPAYVAVPSLHGAGEPIWSKFYAADSQYQGKRPAVLFVHGAGYTQNSHHSFPYYFREQMFHNLLTSRGYHVLDMDYRASEGYGRDWRTAIYRQMGTPELEDLRDGVAWLIAEHNVDPERIGIYGGSYGGFMTLMALFKAPDDFAVGAALRPVTDWRHYNHGYTSAILNTPSVDPEAHRRSSPIEYAEGLQGKLLISHGMLDDNVFYKDSVMLAQRLIELEKPNWELASYPLERHSFIHPESWLDQYRRILELFESNLAGPPHGAP